MKLDEKNVDVQWKQPLWYLGLDFGTTGLSVVLLNQETRCFYPLEWLEIHPQTATTEVQVRFAAQIQDLEWRGVKLPRMNRLKSWLDLGLAYQDRQSEPGEPVLQWSDYHTLPYQMLLEAIANRFSQLSAVEVPVGAKSVSYSVVASASSATNPPLNRLQLMEVWNQLSGVIVGCPCHWGDAYRFNLREAILKAGWVNEAQKIVFLEEAIALVLSELRDTAQGIQWQGATLILDAGATTTEFALVDIPLNRSTLTYERFHLGSMGYGGDGIDQDIISQLFLSGDRPLLSLSETDRGEAIAFPEPGEADWERRYQFDRYLRSSRWGPSLLDLAAKVKVRLQVEPWVTVRLQQQERIIERRDLEMKVFVPFLRGLNREINRLFSVTGIAPQGVRQALCTGGSASLVAIARWLRQKLPSAAIIQDRALGENRQKCSRVAYGLANLPFYPQVLNHSRHQYSDYFLLLELLRVVPESAVSESQLFQLLEQRGINTLSCRDRLRSLLAGNLPPGLIPQKRDQPRLTLDSWQKISALSITDRLFTRLDSGEYQVNVPQKQRYLTQFEKILTLSAQTLEDPYLVLF